MQLSHRNSQLSVHKVVLVRDKFLGGETEQIQSSPPLTPGAHAKGKDGSSFSKCWVLGDVLERERGYIREKESHLEAVF